ncbi:hypothetical protein V6N13_148139 [Hibiscus sabdariffa]
MVVESFLSIIAETLLKHIISLATREATALWSGSEMKKLEETMTYIKAALSDAQKLQQHNETLCLTLTKLRAVLYDAEDVLDEFRCEAQRKESTTSKSVRFPSIPFPSVYSLRMGHKIKKINERLEAVAADFKRFNLGEQIQIPQNRPYVVQSHRDTHSFMTFKVLGRERDRENIIDLLVQPRGVENIPVIPIVGIGDRVNWNELKEILMKLDDLHQSKIIVTTRSLAVASIMGTNSPYELGALNHQDSLSLLLKWAFNQGDEGRYPNLLEIADEIVKKCKGVPLAVRTLGSLLAGKTNPQYDTDYIIQFWMANGLLDSPKHVNECSEDIGLQYFMDLWSKGFVQDVKDFPSFYNFKIHDLIHDLALSVSQEDCLTAYQQTLSASDNVRHLAFADRNPLRTPQPFLKKLKGVRTLVILHPQRDFRMMEKSFLSACISYFKYLRLLELQNCLLDALPNSICNLKHLRYLNLNSCKNLSRLPKSIHKLESLLTLRLFNVPNLQVPDKLQRLINLRFLEITTSSLQLWEIRPGNWSSLQYLGIDRCNKLKFMFEGMQHLSSLRRLAVYNCMELESLPRSLKFLEKLEEITILACPKFNLLMEPQGIEDQNLQLSLKTFIFSNLPNLRDLPRLLLEASASHLEFLQIDRCPNLEELPDWFQNLISLQRLEISECPKLHSLPHGVERLTALRQLKIQQCPTLSDKCRPQTGEDWSKISHIHERSHFRSQSRRDKDILIKSEDGRFQLRYWFDNHDAVGGRSTVFGSAGNATSAASSCLHWSRLCFCVDRPLCLPFSCLQMMDV